MSMLTLSGQLINIFESPKGVKDEKEYGGQDKIQILGEVVLQNGESRNDLITLTTHDKQLFEGLKGKSIRVPVSVFANGKSITYFIPKGSKPTAAH
ncbi:hypothetical protein [Pseudoalteromonas sp. S3260]|jgi:hypothetical protein|uniref:hypothetical protein n=2 Tax=unclassified Pseudoalteromonas TaxID=194690 RepID=UPI00201DF62D|nr:hypothetical protein [Pseudoalteromonas sp. S3260]|tara:strand:- start:172 stop:459 length:288 start_codon:yes stop_codon:yes gene_type:complete